MIVWVLCLFRSQALKFHKRDNIHLLHNDPEDTRLFNGENFIANRSVVSFFNETTVSDLS